ncbi:hypothetical protein M3J09_002756 [Ascochyta lentis]
MTWLKLRRVPQLCTPRPSSSTRAPKPQPSTTDGTLRLQRQQTASAVAITRVRQLRAGHCRTSTHKAHVSISPPSACSHPLKPCSTPKCCPAALCPGAPSAQIAPPRASAVFRARCRTAMLPSAHHWLSSRLVCVSEAYKRQHDAMQRRPRLSVKASDRHAGASAHMDEACGWMQIDQDARLV